MGEEFAPARRLWCSATQLLICHGHHRSQYRHMPPCRWRKIAAGSLLRLSRGPWPRDRRRCELAIDEHGEVGVMPNRLARFSVVFALQPFDGVR